MFILKKEMRPENYMGNFFFLPKILISFFRAKKLEVDNSNFLHQGLSTTYNDFHWYADQSLQLTKQLY